MLGLGGMQNLNIAAEFGIPNVVLFDKNSLHEDMWGEIRLLRKKHNDGTGFYDELLKTVKHHQEEREKEKLSEYGKYWESLLDSQKAFIISQQFNRWPVQTVEAELKDEPLSWVIKPTKYNFIGAEFESGSIAPFTLDLLDKPRCEMLAEATKRYNCQRIINLGNILILLDTNKIRERISYDGSYGEEQPRDFVEIFFENLRLIGGKNVIVIDSALDQREPPEKERYRERAIHYSHTYTIDELEEKFRQQVKDNIVGGADSPRNRAKYSR